MGAFCRFMTEHRPETNGYHHIPNLDARVVIVDNNGIEHKFWNSQIIDIVDYSSSEGTGIKLKRDHHIPLDGITKISVG